MWNIWEQLRCVAHSPQIVGTTIALLFSLETCIVQRQSVRVTFACPKCLFKLSAETIINVRNARLCATCAIFLLKIKQIPFSCRLAREFTILRRLQNNFKMLVYCPGKYCSNREECEFPWQLCINSEIHLWLWKLWSSVFCTQNYFHVTRARKDDKSRQNTFFLLKKR